MKALKDMSISELRKLNKQVIDMVKLKQQMEAVDTRAVLFVGQKVGINHNRYKGVKAEITKVNRTKVHVKIKGNLSGLVVPMSMLIIK